MREFYLSVLFINTWFSLSHNDVFQFPHYSAVISKLLVVYKSFIANCNFNRMIFDGRPA
jgi:hypothetical protein